MSIINHLIAADVRRHRLLLVAWLAIVIATTTLAGARPALAAGGVGPTVGILSSLLSLTQVLLLLVLIPAVIQTHPLVGSDAFWMTRPIPPGTLLVAKLVLLGVATIVIPTLAEAILMAAYAVPLAQIVVVAAQTALYNLLLADPPRHGRRADADADAIRSAVRRGARRSCVATRRNARDLHGVDGGHAANVGRWRRRRPDVNICAHGAGHRRGADAPRRAVPGADRACDPLRSVQQSLLLRSLPRQPGHGLSSLPDSTSRRGPRPRPRFASTQTPTRCGSMKCRHRSRGGQHGDWREPASGLPASSRAGPPMRACWTRRFASMEAPLSRAGTPVIRRLYQSRKARSVQRASSFDVCSASTD